jgi:hypothetical protein
MKEICDRDVNENSFIWKLLNMNQKINFMIFSNNFYKPRFNFHKLSQEDGKWCQKYMFKCGIHLRIYLTEGI